MGERNLKKNRYIYVCITDHCAVHLKLTQHCKSTILQKQKINFSIKYDIYDWVLIDTHYHGGFQDQSRKEIQNILSGLDILLQKAQGGKNVPQQNKMLSKLNWMEPLLGQVDEEPPSGFGCKIVPCFLLLMRPIQEEEEEVSVQRKRNGYRSFEWVQIINVYALIVAASSDRDFATENYSHGNFHHS